MATLEDLKPEPGHSRCGNSYAKEILVSGQLPNGYGKDNTHTLEPVADKPSGSWWGRRSPEEAEFSDQIQAAIARLKDDIGGNTALIPSEAAALSSMTYLAEQNLKQVSEIYDFWDGKTGGLPRDSELSGRESEWPLDTSDILSQYMYACRPKMTGKWVPIRAGLGEGPVVRNYYCHMWSLTERRVEDRLRIWTLLDEAARAVRCAEWTMWRVTLYRQSLAEFDEIDAGTLAPAPPVAPEPTFPVGPGMFAPMEFEDDPYVPPPPKIPEEPVDATISAVDPPPPLPPPPAPGPESATMPDGPELPGLPTDPLGAPLDAAAPAIAPESPWPARIPYIVAGAALVGFAVTRK